MPESLKPLFEYINDPSKGVGDALVDHIDERVKKFNTHEWRRKHMYASAYMLQITLKIYHEMCHALWYIFSVIKGIKSKSILV